MGENGKALMNLNWASSNRPTGLTSRKYKDNNWFGAMYTYAIAWGCLIPYHPDDMEDSDPKKKEIASLYVSHFASSHSPHYGLYAVEVRHDFVEYTTMGKTDHRHSHPTRSDPLVFLVSG